MMNGFSVAFWENPFTSQKLELNFSVDAEDCYESLIRAPHNSFFQAEYPPNS
jgi:hypothetical protein